MASFAALGAAIGCAAAVTTFELVEEPMPAPPADDVAAADCAGASGNARTSPPQQLARQAAAKFVAAEHALWYPTIAAVGVAGVTPYHQDTLNDHYAAAGFNVTVPIANGSLYSARHARGRVPRARSKTTRSGTSRTG